MLLSTQTAVEFFTSVMREYEPYIVALSFFGFLACVFILVNRIIEVRERVRQRAIAFNPIQQRDSESGRSTRSSSRKSDIQGQLEQASELLYKIERGLSDSKESRISTVRRELVQAGYFNNNSVFWFYFSRLFLAILGGATPIAIVSVYQIQVSILILMAICIGSAMAGLITPGFYLSYRQSVVRSQCRLGFPDFLDLLVVCTQAGIPPRALLNGSAEI